MALMPYGTAFQERVIARRALFGLLQTYPNPVFSEMAGICGYDFLILDGEHGLFSEMDYLQALQTLRSTQMAAFVRLSAPNSSSVGRFLDIGADGIVAPNVTTADQVRALVRAMYYPPKGNRGFGAAAHRATHYGIELAAHLKSPRSAASLVLMIESSEGVTNIEQILSVDGVDAVFVGPFDLSADLGCAGNFSMPAYVDAFAQVERVASAYGKVFGTAPHPGHPAEALIARGHRLLVLGSDTSLIRETMTAKLAKARTCL
jgi:2-keto-3-deoxy-L-rhamnonate aldolase RhmA